MKTMVSKHKTKFMTMGALNQINKEAYGKDYQANIEKILKEGTLELFLDPR